MQTAIHKTTLLAALAVVALAGHAYAATVFQTDTNKDGIVNFKDHDQNGGIEKVVDLSNNWLGTYTVINNVYDLKGITDMTETYVLGNDIDCNGVEMESIGSEDNPFTGTFIGNGHKISNVKINAPSKDFAGLFGALDDGAEVYDLDLENVDIFSSKGAGVVAGTVYNGKIARVSSSGKVQVYNGEAGGIAGRMYKGTISDCVSDCNTFAKDYAGGILGRGIGAEPNNLIIENCYATGIASAARTSAGGVVGSAANMTIKDTYATGTASALFAFGGLVGFSFNLSVSNSYHTGPNNGIGTFESGGADAFKGLEHSHPVYGTVETPIWDFENVWEAHADSLPTLRRNPQPTPPQP